MRRYDVPALLMGGQACVLYGAAEFSRDLDLAVLASDDGVARLSAAMQALDATVIAVPAFDRRFLDRGHAVHFSVPAVAVEGTVPPLRVDVMSRMRGVASFDALWSRRTTIALSGGDAVSEVSVDVLSLADLVQAKKTQRDKDWPMLRRLVDASYANGRDASPSAEQIAFWLRELRSPEFLTDAVARFPEDAGRSDRAAVMATVRGGDIVAALADEQASEMSADREYWLPLRRELEQLRHEVRRAT